MRWLVMAWDWDRTGLGGRSPSRHWNSWRAARIRAHYCYSVNVVKLERLYLTPRHGSTRTHTCCHGIVTPVRITCHAYRSRCRSCWVDSPHAPKPRLGQKNKRTVKKNLRPKTRLSEKTASRAKQKQNQPLRAAGIFRVRADVRRSAAVSPQRRIFKCTYSPVDVEQVRPRGILGSDSIYKETRRIGRFLTLSRFGDLSNFLPGMILPHQIAKNLRLARRERRDFGTSQTVGGIRSRGDSNTSHTHMPLAGLAAADGGLELGLDAGASSSPEADEHRIRYAD
jgi:hypothetical protein